MKPLIVLLAAFAAALVIIYLAAHRWNYALAVRIAMSVMLAFTAIGHFVFAKGMTMMLPDFIPFRKMVVIFTGLLEIAGAAGLLVPGTRCLAAWLLILFFILILPANIYAAVKHVDYQQANFAGPGLAYLWFRIPLQLLFIAWIYFSAGCKV